MNKIIRSKNENFEGYVFAAILKVLDEDLTEIRLVYESKLNNAMNIRIYSSNISFDGGLNLININELGDSKAYVDLNNTALNLNIDYILNESIDEKKFKEVEKGKRESMRLKLLFNEPDFPEEFIATRESIKIAIDAAYYKVIFEINCAWEYFDDIVDKVVKRKDELLKELEEEGYVNDVLPVYNEYYDDDNDPGDRRTGSCIFCGNSTYDGDILCPDCANNVD